VESDSHPFHSLSSHQTCGLLGSHASEVILAELIRHVRNNWPKDFDRPTPDQLCQSNKVITLSCSDSKYISISLS